MPYQIIFTFWFLSIAPLLSYGFMAGKVTLKSNSNQLLTICNNCGPGVYNDSAAVYGNNPSDPLAIWTVQTVGSKIAFKGGNGNYLARCNNCWNDGASDLDSAFVHVTNILDSPEALWTPQKLSNGKWAFKGDNQKYLSRCIDCVRGGDKTSFAFVNINSNYAVAQWTVRYIVPLGRVTLQSDSGKFLARCNKCGPGNYQNSAGLYSVSQNDPQAIWTLQAIGNQVAIKADSGYYLARCNNCWTKGAIFPDSAFVHAPSFHEGSPWTIWTPQWLGNGKWAFRSDTGKYLARCNGCVVGGQKPSFAFIQSDNNQIPSAQWKVQVALG